jgi:hypothetical protein
MFLACFMLGNSMMFTRCPDGHSADFGRVVDGILVEHWDVVEDEASEAESKRVGRCSGIIVPRRQSDIEGKPVLPVGGQI